jgi:hypothetical protein
MEWIAWYLGEVGYDLYRGEKKRGAQRGWGALCGVTKERLETAIGACRV